jgi:hypothetical protein
MLKCPITVPKAMETRDYKHILVNPPEGMVIDALRTLPCSPSAAEIEFYAHTRIKQMEEALLQHAYVLTGEFERYAPGIVPFQTAKLEYGTGGAVMTYTVKNLDDFITSAARINPPIRINHNAIIDFMAKTQARGGRPAHFQATTHNADAWQLFARNHLEELITLGYIPRMGELYLDQTGDPKFYEQAKESMPRPTSLMFRPDDSWCSTHPTGMIGIVGTTGMNVETAVKQWFDELQRRHGINPEEKEITGSPSGTTFSM